MSEVEEKLRDLLQSLQKEREKASEKDHDKPAVSEKDAKAIRTISDRFKAYENTSSFRVGDIVKWKAGMRNRRFPAQDEIAIVTKVYPAPIYDENSKDSGSPQFHDPMSVVLGVIDDDGDFVEFHYDGNRFEIASRMDSAPRRVTQLRDRMELLNNVEHFEVGDIVTFKEGLRNKKHPEPGTAAIVVKVLNEPLYDKASGAGSPYYNEVLTLVIGIIDDDGDFLCFHTDPRRFTHIPPL